MMDAQTIGVFDHQAYLHLRRHMESKRPCRLRRSPITAYLYVTNAAVVRVATALVVPQVWIVRVGFISDDQCSE
jgi:hypothetical protein